MKALLSLALAALVPSVALAQGAPAKPAVSAPAKSAGSKSAKSGAAKPAGNAARRSSGALSPSARKAVEEVTPIEDDPSVQLTDADREVARRVFVGSIPCELGASVTLTPMKREGFFMVTTKGHRFQMHPVESRTGAIRLEDPRRGAMWLQLGNKSMLMSQKLGQRLADECQSPQQVTVADELKRNPRPSILEAAPAAPAALSSPQPAAGAGALTAPAPASDAASPSTSAAGTPAVPAAPAAPAN